MAEAWPPSGHSFSYRVDVNLDGRPPFSFDLTTPNTREKFGLSAVRVGRHGGVSKADEEFRGKLYSLLGEYWPHAILPEV